MATESLTGLPVNVARGHMSLQRIATVIRELRAAQQLTHADLAKRTKIARGYLADIEAGHRKNPSLAVLQRLAKALGVPVTALLG
jgi:transcriptional regulator with XRE-family HTH domain